MSFKENSSQQFTMSDHYWRMTDRERNFADHSWAPKFSDKIFPLIDEEPYRVLYGPANSRPNTPVNVIIGALVLKEMFGLSDDEVVENLMFDVRWQIALRTTSFEEQPLSDRTLGRFRERLVKYEQETGIDLLHNTMQQLFAHMAEVMDVNNHKIRMDSMMIESNIKKLGRLGLIYTCVSRLVVRLHKCEFDDVIGGLERYYDPADYNRTIYRRRDEDQDTRMSELLADAKVLLDNCLGDVRCTDWEEYQSLVRVISEQTVQNEDGSYRLRTKEDGGMDSKILQNPTDPDATFRSKAGKDHRGYAANVQEVASDDDGPKRTLVTDYQYDQNTHSDTEFMSEALDAMPDPSESGESEPTIIVTDGAYASSDNSTKAAEKNAQIITTDLTGRKTPDINADFTFSEDGKTILSCPAGYEPDKCSYQESTGKVTATYNAEQCQNCPHRDECHPNINEKKGTAKVQSSKKSSDRAQTQRFLKSDEMTEYSHFRNGVETIPSILRRQYDVDAMPVRGLLRTKLWFGFKVAALNCRKLFNYLDSLGQCAPIMGMS